MRWTDYIDEAEVRRALSVLKDEDDLFEARIVGKNKEVLSGYFTNADTLLSAFDKLDVRGKNIYITLNYLNEDVYNRDQHDKFLKNPSTTHDDEVVKYKWFFIDLDPVRLTGISSTDGELNAAEVLMHKVKVFLTELGFGTPVTALSGNGFHLLYRIDLDNTRENNELVKACLESVANIFNNDSVKIDVVNYNPSRICKLHGTLAQKGSNTMNRPHRMSKLLSFGEAGIVGRDKLEKLASLSERNQNAGHFSVVDEFDIVSWMDNHGITYRNVQTGRDSVIYPLDKCPFDHSHRNGDAKIFKYTNGAIAFKCHHNSCRDYKWQDVRKMFEPEYGENHFYDNDRIEQGYKQIKDNWNVSSTQAEPKKKERKNRQLKKASDLMLKELEEPNVLVGVGDELPILVEGTCILSAKPKLGKSWLALSMCIAIANGSDFLGYKTSKKSVLYLDLETSEQLQQKRMRKALNGAPVPENFYLDTETDGIDNGFVEQIENYMEQDPDIGVVIIDVFQIIRSASKNSKESEYDHAYRDISPLNQLANKYHISIILVCHDRKVVDPDDPFSNILGSTGLQGAATQMIVMYKPKKDSPIHISIKGKTIDGLPELNVELKNGQWNVVGNTHADDESERVYEYENSPIREAVLRILNYQEVRGQTEWRGKAGQIIEMAAVCGVGLTQSAKEVGGFMTKNIGLFKSIDDVTVTKIMNGSSSGIYRLCKLLVMTSDECIDYFD